MTRAEFIAEAEKHGIVPGATIQHRTNKRLGGKPWVVPSWDKLRKYLGPGGYIDLLGIDYVAWRADEGCPTNWGWILHNHHWAEVVTPATNTPTPMIKKGDIVERTSGKQNGMRAGHADEVIRVHSNGLEVTLKNYGPGHAPSKLRVVSGTYAVNDSEIRVGDTVEVLRDGPQGSFFLRGQKFVVEKMEGGMYYGNTPERKSRGVSSNYVLRTDIKKINNGARPVSGSTNTNTNGKVSGQFESEGYGCGEGRAVRAQSSAGRIATGEPLDCNPRKGGLRRAAVASSEVPVSAGC